MTSLRVERVAGLATVQDAGRPGWMHQGVPPGGALVLELLARANVAVGNAPGASAIELFGRITVSAPEAPLVVGREDGAVLTLQPGDALSVATPSSRRVAYVAVRGGIAVPMVLGGRGTLLVASIGGHEGRALRPGDRLPVGERSAGEGAGGLFAALPPVDAQDARPIRVIPGPNLGRFDPKALATLTGAAFVVLPTSDRAGTRLEGPPLPRIGEDTDHSMPMVAGAIEVPASGPPIVLGPDHPTTGGYPVLAVIARADLGRFGVLPVGAAVRFRC